MVDEIIALNTRISEKYDFDLAKSLISRLQHLDPTVATLLFERCLATPSTPASLHLLATCYEKGIGTTRDDAKCLEFLHKASDLGEARACSCLGYRYRNGPGVPQDMDRALNLYRKSGTPNSLWNLATHHQETDPETAMEYFVRAWALYPPGRDRDECKQRILAMTARNGDLMMGMLQQLIHHRRETEDQRTRIAELEAQVESLHTELTYRPGGPGFREAREDFELRAGCQISIYSGVGLDA